MHHATNPPLVQRITEQHLPLEAHGLQITGLPGGDRIEGDHRIQSTPHQPQDQQRPAIAPGHRQGGARTHLGLQKVTGAEKEKRHRKAGDLIEKAGQIDIDGPIPGRGIKGVRKG